VDDGGDDAARGGSGRVEVARCARRAVLRRVVSRRLDGNRPGGLRRLPAARRRGRGRADDRRRTLRAHAAQAPLPAALPRERPLGLRVRGVVRRLEHRADGRAARTRRHERHLDGARRRPRPRPEAPAAAGRARRAGRARDRRPRHPGGHVTDHRTGTREEWLAARLELLQAEKELTRRSDELARERQELPWVRIDKDYRFETDEGGASLADLFRGRSQLLVYHFMFGPEYTAGCPACSSIADGFDGFVVHLENHDVAMTAISRAPLDKLQA